MLCTVLTPLKKHKNLARHYNDSMGFNRGKSLLLLVTSMGV